MRDASDISASQHIRATAASLQLSEESRAPAVWNLPPYQSQHSDRQITKFIHQTPSVTCNTHTHTKRIDEVCDYKQTAVPYFPTFFFPKSCVLNSSPPLCASVWLCKHMCKARLFFATHLQFTRHKSHYWWQERGTTAKTSPRSTTH